MLRTVHLTLFLTELLSWSLTLLVLASQHSGSSDLSLHRSTHYWINGSHSAPANQNGTFASPGFPTTLFMPLATYTFHLSHRSKHGRIALNFSDFFLAPLDGTAECGSDEYDYLKIIDGTRSMSHCGHSRPQPYVSHTHQLTIEYHQGSPSGQRLHPVSFFQAHYKFISRIEGERERKRIINGFYDQSTHFSSAGYGEISFHLPTTIFPVSADYLWYIQVPEESHVQLNILDLELSEKLWLKVNDGLTSSSELLANYQGNTSLLETSSRTITSTQSLLRVRLTGITQDRSRLYAVFTEANKEDLQGDCPQGFFSCGAGVCIPNERVCDGLDHCAHGEDEEELQCSSERTDIGRPLKRSLDDAEDCGCLNGGTCIRGETVSSSEGDQTTTTATGYRCQCKEDFTGSRCQVKSSAKRRRLAAVMSRCGCKNGGTCTPTSSGYNFVCSCSPGFNGFDCSRNDSSAGGGSPTEYGIAMGAAVVAVLLVMFGVALCICVILQYLRQQRDGPESPYNRTLSRDVYSVEGVDIAGLQMEALTPNDYVPPTYTQCMHQSPSSPDGDVFLTPSQSSQYSIASRWRVRTPESPPPSYDAILGFCKECSEMAQRSWAKHRQHSASQSLQTPTSEQFETMSGNSSNLTAGNNTGNNTPSGGAFPAAVGNVFGSLRGSIRGRIRGNQPPPVAASQSQTQSPTTEEYELRRVQSTS